MYWCDGNRIYVVSFDTQGKVVGKHESRVSAANTFTCRLTSIFSDAGHRPLAPRRFDKPTDISGWRGN
jgi:hypothetical protein